jgi:phosphohistidine phosphatase SixA
MQHHHTRHSHRRRQGLKAVLAGLLAPWGWPAKAATSARWPEGSVLLLRHALAPGVGDPPGFRLSDCGTQRNLNEAGRAQAQRLGAALRAQAGEQGARVGAVWSSMWCRCLETARLAFPDLSVLPQPALNSFFEDRSQAAAQTQHALAALATWRGPGVLVVVTHMVNVQSLTGVTLGSGQGVLAQLERRGQELVLRPLRTVDLAPL